MNSRPLPLLTAGFVTVLLALPLLVTEPSLLYFGRADIMRGEIWRLITGHFVHAGTEHLLWNALGLAALGGLIERRSRRLLATSLMLGIMAVSILLLSPLAGLEYYCGLSGALNALLAVALWLEWKATRSRLVVLVAVACIAKTVVETTTGSALVTDIDWPPYAWSHVAGLIGGLLWICLGGRVNRWPPPRTGGSPGRPYFRIRR